MNIYCVRHGDYIKGDSDSERHLSDKGSVESELLAGFLKKMKVTPDYIWHSGKQRSLETAEILSNAFKAAQIEVKDSLSPLDPVESIIKEIGELNKDIIIVGHLPFLPKLVSAILFGDNRNDFFHMDTSSVLSLIKVEEKWGIEWFVSPAQLRSFD